MSHVVKVKDVQMNDVECVKAAVARMPGAKLPNGLALQSYKLFTGAPVTGIAIELPDWKYPVVVEPESGKVSYDNYGERWGKQMHLDELVQAYSIEKMRSTAISAGMTLQEIEDEETHDITLVCTQI